METPFYQIPGWEPHRGRYRLIEWLLGAMGHVAVLQAADGTGFITMSDVHITHHGTYFAAFADAAAIAQIYAGECGCTKSRPALARLRGVEVREQATDPDDAWIIQREIRTRMDELGDQELILRAEQTAWEIIAEAFRTIGSAEPYTRP